MEYVASTIERLMKKPGERAYIISTYVIGKEKILLEVRLAQFCRRGACLSMPVNGYANPLAELGHNWLIEAGVHDERFRSDRGVKYCAIPSMFSSELSRVQVHRRCGVKLHLSERKMGIMRCLQLEGVIQPSSYSSLSAQPPWCTDEHISHVMSSGAT